MRTMHSCYLCNHVKAIEKIGELEELLKKSLPFLKETQDQRPSGEGWKSKELEELIYNVEQTVGEIHTGVEG